MSVLVIMLRLLLTWRENAALLRASQQEALTDALTGLANRRALALELERAWPPAEDQAPYLLALFDLDGFKHYNDTFGHPTGDALLQRLGRNLAAQLAGRGTAYRMGGDEFCALIDDVAAPDATLRAVAAARSASTARASSSGAPTDRSCCPTEAQSAETALRLADQRMYAQKRGERSSASRQSADVLLRALSERNPELGTHLHDVALLAARRGTAVRAASGGDREHSPGGGAPRRRQGGGPRRDPVQAGPAERDRMELHPPPHPDRRADHRRCPRAPSGRGDRPLDPRKLRRDRIPRRARWRGRSRWGHGSSTSATRSTR